MQLHEVCCNKLQASLGKALLVSHSSECRYNDYLSLLSTLSPYIALEANQRLALFTALEEVLATNFGTSIQTSYLSILQVAQKI